MVRQSTMHVKCKTPNIVYNFTRIISSLMAYLAKKLHVLRSVRELWHSLQTWIAWWHHLEVFGVFCCEYKNNTDVIFWWRLTKKLGKKVRQNKIINFSHCKFERVRMTPKRLKESFWGQIYPKYFNPRKYPVIKRLKGITVF